MTTKVRKGQAPDMLARSEFGMRFRGSFVDPAFRGELDTELADRSKPVPSDLVDKGIPLRPSPVLKAPH